MRLKLTLMRGDGTPEDVAVTIDSTTTNGDLAATIERRDPTRGSRPPRHELTLAVMNAGSWDSLPSSMAVVDSGVQSGSSIAVVEPGSVPTSADQGTVGTLRVVSGPQAGSSFPLRAGVNVVGRGAGCDIRLTDPLVSAKHAKITVSDVVEVIDTNSSNGVQVGDSLVARAEIKPSDPVIFGDTEVRVELSALVRGVAAMRSPLVEFNRSPYLRPSPEATTVTTPKPPAPPQSGRMPWVALLAPLLMGGVLFAATRQASSLLFVLLTPVMMVGGWVENRISGKRAFAHATEAFHQGMAELSVRVGELQDAERRDRLAAAPSGHEVLRAAGASEGMLWSRRPDQPGMLSVRLGLGTQPSLVTVELPQGAEDSPLFSEALDFSEHVQTIDGVPLVGDLLEQGNLGVAGPRERMLDSARSLMAQIAGLHSPSEVAICAVTSTATSRDWEWLRWLPHTSTPHLPFDAAQLASTAGAAAVLLEALDDVVATRHAERAGRAGLTGDAVRVVLLVEDDAPVARSLPVGIAERGPEVGVHVVWVATTEAGLPAACRRFLSLGAGSAVVGDVGSATRTTVAPDVVDRGSVEQLARRAAPLVDAGARIEDASDLPRAVSLLSLVGEELGENGSAVVERWIESDSVPGAPRQGKPRPASLRALVGQTAGGPLFLDLRGDGPHALVGGTTGSGKSEFLQSWILALAATLSPARVNFLLVDYKGGAAFADCVELPHTVGLVTDLTPHLVKRALASLDAELRYREHVLNSKSAKDLVELERRGDPDAPPSLIIVVDEFAALVQEVPEFVDGVVNVAQRGRSLGLHLVLATQRPAGVIRDNLRANTNLRVALRVADEADSQDVLGTPVAAAFSPDTPGRAAVKSGPGRLVSFQAGYAGGWTTKGESEGDVLVESLVFGAGTPWEEPEDEHAPARDVGAKDIERMVTTLREAASSLDLPALRRPWLPELAERYRLEALPTRRLDSELVFGVSDLPGLQEQPAVAFYPDVDGNLAILGTGGSGKSTALRTLAEAAAFTARGGPCHVYGLDFSSRGLSMLEELPHVGAIIGADDAERTGRLLRWLRELVDERATRYAAVRAATIGDYRTLASRPDEARIMLLVDGFGAFRQAYEVGERHRYYDTLLSLAADGRGVGVHVVVTADRPGAIPSALSSAIPRRLVLRLADDNDLLMAGVPKGGFDGIVPPGRGFLDDIEVQVASLKGSANVLEQAEGVTELARTLRAQGMADAPGIARLPERVPLSSLPAVGSGQIAIGLGDETLGPITVPSRGTWLVAGPPGSGRTTALVLVGRALAAAGDLRPRILLTPRRSGAGMPGVDRVVAGADAVMDAATELTSATAPVVVLVESIGDLSTSSADFALQEMVKALRDSDSLIICEGETSTLTSYAPLLQLIKASRQGIALQPDQLDGDPLFRTPFPRVRRADFPLGRGLLVRSGRAEVVQLAMPD